MNLNLFNELIKKRPSQHPVEWKMFLIICELYLKEHKIDKPVVVELGIWKNRQKAFYEQLFGAEHIGIDISKNHSIPDILGDTHDSRTFAMLKERLDGRPINILFIDAGHTYEDVKRDFEMYTPLCTDIVAFHDIETGRYWLEERGEEISFRMQLWKFWADLTKKQHEETKENKRYLFLSFHKPHIRKKMQKAVGIGMIIKK